MEVPNLVLNNEVIKRVEKIKYLGINIDESLNWEEQYKTVKNKLKGGITSYCSTCCTVYDIFVPVEQRASFSYAIWENVLNYLVLKDGLVACVICHTR